MKISHFVIFIFEFYILFLMKYVKFYLILEWLHLCLFWLLFWLFWLNRSSYWKFQVLRPWFLNSTHFCDEVCQILPYSGMAPFFGYFGSIFGYFGSIGALNKNHMSQKVVRDAPCVKTLLYAKYLRISIKTFRDLTVRTCVRTDVQTEIILKI